MDSTCMGVSTMTSPISLDINTQNKRGPDATLEDMENMTCRSPHGVIGKRFVQVESDGIPSLPNIMSTNRNRNDTITNNDDSVSVSFAPFSSSDSANDELSSAFAREEDITTALMGSIMSPAPMLSRSAKQNEKQILGRPKKPQQIQALDKTSQVSKQNQVLISRKKESGFVGTPALALPFNSSSLFEAEDIFSPVHSSSRLAVPSTTVTNNTSIPLLSFSTSSNPSSPLISPSSLSLTTTGASFSLAFTSAFHFPSGSVEEEEDNRVSSNNTMTAIRGHGAFIDSEEEDDDDGAASSVGNVTPVLLTSAAYDTSCVDPITFTEQWQAAGLAPLRTKRCLDQLLSGECDMTNKNGYDDDSSEEGMEIRRMTSSDYGDSEKDGDSTIMDMDMERVSQITNSESFDDLVVPPSVSSHVQPSPTTPISTNNTLAFISRRAGARVSRKKTQKKKKCRIASIEVDTTGVVLPTIPEGSSYKWDLANEKYVTLDNRVINVMDIRQSEMERIEESVYAGTHALLLDMTHNCPVPSLQARLRRNAVIFEKTIMQNEYTPEQRHLAAMRLARDVADYFADKKFPLEDENDRRLHEMYLSYAEMRWKESWEHPFFAVGKCPRYQCRRRYAQTRPREGGRFVKLSAEEKEECRARAEALRDAEEYETRRRRCAAGFNDDIDSD